MANSSVKKIYINSTSGLRDPSPGTDTSFTITKLLSEFNAIPKRVKLLSATIPVTWDNITTNNNALQLIETPGPVTNTITVPSTWYTGTTLAAALQTALNAAPGGIHTYTVTYNSSTFGFLISATGNFQINFVVPNSIAAALGFGQVVTAVGTSVTSTQVALINADSEIMISSNLVGGTDNGIVPWFSGPETDLNLLAVVPITACHGSYINYSSPVNEPWQDVQQSIFAQSLVNVVLSFSLLFLSGNVINLHGGHWSATILLDF